MTDNRYQEFTITVLHVHPDGWYKKRTIRYICDMECQLSGLIRSVNLGIMPTWRGAYPVMFNGSEINPFDAKALSNLNNRGIGCQSDTITILYDYVKSSYSFSASSPVFRFLNKSTAPFSLAHGCVSPYIGSCYRPPNEKVRPIGYCLGMYGLSGFSTSVAYRGSTPSVGFAVDTEKYKSLKRWSCGIDVKIDTLSKIMIGRQQRNGHSVTCSDQKVDHYEPEQYVDPETGETKTRMKPIYVSYSYSGPGIGFSQVVSDISVHPFIMEPGPPGPTAYGSVWVRTFKDDGSYLTGITLLYDGGDWGPGGGGKATSPDTAIFPAGTTCKVFAFYTASSGVVYYGEGSILVEAWKTKLLEIVLTEAELHDFDITVVTEAQFTDGTTGYAGVSGVQATATGMSINTGVSGKQVVETLEVTINGGKGIINAIVGTAVGVKEVTSGEFYDKNLKKSIGITVPMKLVYDPQPDGSVHVRMVPDTAKIIENIKMSDGWKPIGDALHYIKNQLKQDVSNAIVIGTFSAVKFLYDTGVGGRLFLAGTLSNAVAAVYTFNSEPKIPEEEEEEEEEKKEEEKKEDDPIKEPEQPPNDPYDNPPYVPVKPIPHDPCYYATFPVVTETDDYTLSPGDPDEEPDPKPDEPKPDPEKIYSYHVISQASFAGRDPERYAYTLYNTSGNISGKGNEVATISVTRNIIDLGNYKYTADAPIGILSYDSDTGIHVSNGDCKQIGENSFNFTIGTIPDKSVIVVLGSWIEEEIFKPIKTGSVIIEIEPGEVNCYVECNGETQQGTRTLFVLPENQEFTVTVSADNYETTSIIVVSDSKKSRTYKVILKPLVPDPVDIIIFQIRASGAIIPNMACTIKSSQESVNTSITLDQYGRGVYSTKIKNSYSVFHFYIDFHTNFHHYSGAVSYGLQKPFLTTNKIVNIVVSKYTRMWSVDV